MPTNRVVLSLLERYNLRKLAQLTFAVIFCLIHFGCSSEAPPIRIGVNPWPGYEYLHLAQKKGYYEKLGVKVELVEFSSLADNRRAYERGQVDAFAGTMVELVLVHHQSHHKPKAFMLCDYSNGADMLLARKEITNLQELKGHKVGLEPASLDVIVVANALVEAGLRFEDIIVVPTFQNEMPQALEDGSVDAVQTYPPNSVQIMERDDVHKLFDTSMVPGQVIDLVAASPEILASRPHDFDKIVAAFYKARQFHESNPEEAVDIMAARERISPEAFNEALAGMVMIPLDQQPEFFQENGKFSKAFKVALEGLKQTGLIDQDINVHDCYDPGPVSRTVAR